MNFIWDEKKNAANRTKHGVSFEEASTLFSSGADYLEMFDESHSDDEERFVAIGPISRAVLVVVWTEQDEGTIRIISARRATKSERAYFETFLEQQ